MNRNDGSAQPAQLGFTERMQASANAIAGIAGIFATFAEVALFRRRFGERYFNGWNTGLVIPLLLIFPMFWPNHDPSPLLLCLLLYVFMCGVHRIANFRRRRRGDSGSHSRYNGESALQRYWPEVSEDVIKRKHEPAVMLCMGLAALVVSPPLGSFFLCCGLAMAVHAGLLTANQRRRMLDLTDARIEGQLLMESSSEPSQMAMPKSSDVVRIHRSSP